MSKIVEDISTWERIWRSGKPAGISWMAVTTCGEGPISHLPSGESVIFHEPWPPVNLYGVGEIEVDVRRAKNCIIGKWTGKTR
jgi:hypothetical protein